MKAFRSCYLLFFLNIQKGRGGDADRVRNCCAEYSALKGVIEKVMEEFLLKRLTAKQV